MECASRPTREGAGGRPWDTLPESPPGTDGGSVRVNTAATAANTARPPRRPPERRGPTRVARPPAGPLPSSWRPMGPTGPGERSRGAPQDSRGPEFPRQEASAARAAASGSGPGPPERTFLGRAWRGRGDTAGLARAARGFCACAPGGGTRGVIWCFTDAHHKHEPMLRKASPGVGLPCLRSPPLPHSLGRV